KHQSHRYVYGGHDPGVCARQVGANSSWLLGYADKAAELGRETLELAERIAHPFSLYLAFGFVAELYLHRREPDLALRLVDRLEALAAEQRFAPVIQPGILRGTALTMHGATDDAVHCIREALLQAEKRRTTLFRPFALASLGEALVRQADYSAASAAANEGFETMATTGECWWEAELHRVNGIALMGQNKAVESEGAFEQ